MVSLWPSHFIPLSALVVSLFLPVACDGKDLLEICTEIQKLNKTGLCKSDLESVRPLSPVVFNEYTDFDILDLYPSSFLVRPITPEDELSDLSCDENGTVVFSRMSDEPVTDGGRHRASRLLDYLIESKEASSIEDLNFISEGAARFKDCVTATLPKARDSHFTWAVSSSGQNCLKIGRAALVEISNYLPTLTERKDRNVVLRKIATSYGDPQILADMLLLFPWDTFGSNDEFLSCTVIIEDIIMHLNVHQRNVDGEGNPWKCETCQLRQHPQWYASHVVAGKVTYTMAQADCRHPTDGDLPSDDELDTTLAQSDESGSLLDAVGTRFTIGDAKNIVWETTGRMPLKAGQSILFSPFWYHRIIPPTLYASKSAVTLVAKYKKDPMHVPYKDVQNRQHTCYLLRPDEILPETTTKKLACYKVFELYQSLANPFLNVEAGLDVFPCDPDKLHDTKDHEFNKYQYTSADLHHNEL